MKKFSLIYTLFILLSNSSTYALGASNSNEAIGEFYFNVNPNKLYQTLITTYGEGKQSSGLNTTDKDHCYFNKNNKNWTEFTFYQLSTNQLGLSGIFVSNIPLCSREYTPKKNFKPFKTLKNIGLNDTKKKVLKAYGNPQEIIKTEKYEAECKIKNKSFLCPQYGKEVLIYKGTTWSLSFHITNNRVVSMLLGPLE